MKMKVQTFSILAGSAACNARCPFCVSKMTPRRGIRLKEPEVNWEKFKKAAAYARDQGEPTLFPEQITKYLDAMKEYDILRGLKHRGFLFYYAAFRFRLQTEVRRFLIYLSILPSDALLLGHLPEHDTGKLNRQQLELIAPFKRGDRYRFA